MTGLQTCALPISMSIDEVVCVLMRSEGLLRVWFSGIRSEPERQLEVRESLIDMRLALRMKSTSLSFRKETYIADRS